MLSFPCWTKTFQIVCGTGQCCTNFNMNIWKPKVEPAVEEQANLPSYKFWVTKLEGVNLERQYSPLDKLDHGLPTGRLHLHYPHIWRIIVGDWYYLMCFHSPSTPAYTPSTPKFLTLLSLAICPELYQKNPGTFFFPSWTKDRTTAKLAFFMKLFAIKCIIDCCYWSSSWD